MKAALAEFVALGKQIALACDLHKTAREYSVGSLPCLGAVRADGSGTDKRLVGDESGEHFACIRSEGTFRGVIDVAADHHRARVKLAEAALLCKYARDLK